MRPCRKCKESKPLTDFHRDHTGPDGHRPYCKSCISAYQRERYASLPEERRAEVVERSLRRRKANPEVARRDSRRRRRETWDRQFGSQMRHCAVSRGAGYAEFVPPITVLEIHDGVCGVCGEDVDPFQFDVDHIVPVKFGGFHTLANLQPAHPACNRGRDYGEAA